MSIAATIPLSEAVEFINGDRGKNYPDHDAQTSTGHCLFLNTKNVRQGRFDFSSLAFIDQERHGKLGGGTLERNDIVLTIRGTLGNTAIYRDDIPFDVVRINSAMLALRPRPYFDADFIERYLRSSDFLDWVGANQRGSAQPHLRTADIETAKLPLVSLPHQRQIVAKIDSLSAKSRRAREHLDHLPRLVEKYKQAVLAAAFRGDLTLGAAYPRLPLQDAVQDIRYGTAKRCEYEGGDVPVLRIPNVQQGAISLQDLKSASFSPAEQAKLSLKMGDVLIIRSNGSLDLVGRAAVVDSPAVGMLFAGYLIRLRLDSDMLRPSYLQTWLRSLDARMLIEQLAKSTSGVNNINSAQLGQLRVPMPDVTEQDEIVRRVETAFAWIDRLAGDATSARRLIDRLDQSILAKAFRGELVPQAPNDEPASVLLDRIKAGRSAGEGQTQTRRRRRKVDEQPD